MAVYYVTTSGSASNSGLSPNTPWTLTYALATAGAGSTVYIAPGVYRGNFTFGQSGTANSYINFLGDPTASQGWSGISADIVRITNYTSADNGSPSGTPLAGTGKSYLQLNKLVIEGSLSLTSCYEFYINDCNIRGTNSICLGLSPAPSTPNCFVANRVTFTNHYAVSNCWVSISTPNFPTSYDYGLRFNSCLFKGAGQYRGFYATNASGGNGGTNITGDLGFRFFNCMFENTNDSTLYLDYNTTSGFHSYVYNCLFVACGTYALRSQGSSTGCSENYNRFVYCPGPRVGVPAGPNSTTTGVHGFDIAERYQSGLSNIQYYSNILNSLNVGTGYSGIVAGYYPPTRDLFNQPWTTGTNDIGPVAYRNISQITAYQPTERNSSVMSLAPGTTSKSLYLYLGAIGISYNTSGLTAFYTRSRGASTSISLVNQTPTGGYISGGFCEVSNSNQPGLYRLDIPDAAFASGASSVTVGVRGATGTNGAFVDISLSNIQSVLDPTQTIGTTTVGDALNSANVGGVGKWSISGDLLYLYAADGSLTKKLRVKNLRIDV